VRRPYEDVLRLVAALAVVSIAQLTLAAGVPTARASAGTVHGAVDVPASGRPIASAVRAAAPLTSKQRAAVRRLQVAARDLHRTVDKIVRVSLDNAIVYDIDLLSHRADLMLAIRNARSAGLPDIASRYQRILDDELQRVAEHRDFWAFLYRAKDYGQQVARKAHDDDPSLPPAVLDTIAANAANWYANDTLLRVTLRAAKQKRPGLYEITLKNGGDLDRRAYALYRSLSVGSRKTTSPYKGKEGLHELPDANGGFNGGSIGFRRAAETGSDSPAIDINLNGRVIKIHVCHEP
jgi:hypothetical protein